MNLTKAEKEFIKGNKKTLHSIFLKNIRALESSMYSMEAGEARDTEIEFIKYLRQWVQYFDVNRLPRKKMGQNKTGI